jgi:hypothetical protein
VKFNRQNQETIVLGLLTSLVGGVLLGIGSWLLSQSWSVVAIATAAWLVFAGVVAALFRHLYLSMARYRITIRKPMTEEVARRRIKEAKREIWSFQISGSEFTAHSAETYEAWLQEDRNRCLNIAFADPDDTELLKNIVKLSGVANLSDENHAFEHLRALIKTTLERYVKLCEEFPEQVNVRVYDFSPPFSVHAIDPHDEDEPTCSLFVELYLPDLPPRERPSMLLRKDRKLFSPYREKSHAWFTAARPVSERLGSET